MLRRIALLGFVLALVLPGVAHAGRGMFVGLDDDTLKWLWRPNGVVGADRDLGVGTIRITIPYERGQIRPPRLVQIYASRAAKAIVLGQRMVIAVYGTPADAPLNAAARTHYCQFVHHILWRIPQISGAVIWNEANSPAYWPAGAGAPAYERLLARCWDVLHRSRTPVNVIDSTAAHYDPAGFIRGVGAAYRASGRTRPLVDTFGHNPYPENSSEPPWTSHGGTTTVSEGDYETLMGALDDAFMFTGQPIPSAQRRSLWYLEDGFQTTVPDSLARFYRGRENDRFAVPPLSPEQPEGPDQAEQLRTAVELAYCQPAVGAFFNFELLDEKRLIGWQSGLMYTNGMRKPSFLAFRAVVLAVAQGKIDCAKVEGAPVLPSAAPGFSR